MRKTIEFILIIGILLGMLGMIAGLYRGDLRPADPDETKKPGTNAPTDDPAQTYALSGDWIIDETVALKEGLERIEQAVYYDHKGVSFSDMTLYIDSYGRSYINGRIVGDSVTGPSDTIYSGSSDYWNGDENLRRISFGANAQTVSKEFYDAFTSVAQRAAMQSGIEPDREIHKVSGSWVLNGSLELFALVSFDEKISFTSNGESWSSVSFVKDGDSVKLYRSNLTGPDTVATIYENGWSLPEYKVWEFGESEVPVSNAFYRFLVANQVTGVTVEGTWNMKLASQMGDILRGFIAPVDGEIISKTFNVTFEYDGDIHTTIKFVCNTSYPGMTDYYVYGILQDGTEYMMMNPGTWVNSATDMAEGKIIFVEPQIVDPEFYVILSAIGTPAA